MSFSHYLIHSRHSDFVKSLSTVMKSLRKCKKSRNRQEGPLLQDLKEDSFSAIIKTAKEGKLAAVDQRHLCAQIHLLLKGQGHEIRMS
jgi:hypothetical protein